MTTATFGIVGTSTLMGTTKVRWANDLVTRFKMLHKGGHLDIELFELPEAMNKQDAAQWLADSDNFEKLNQDAQYAVSSKLDEYMSVKSEVKISLEEIAQRPKINSDAVNKGAEIKDPALN